MSDPATGTDEALSDALRGEWGRLLALLVAQTRRLDLAEDALAEAFEAGARTWPRTGVPVTPAAWLLTAARRRVIDRIRAEAVAARTAPLLAVDERIRLCDNEIDPQVAIERGGADELLRLVLLCAHPSLAPEAGAALTLRLVLGVSTADIARLFLVSEPTMAARLTRAKHKVVAAGVPLALPEPQLLGARLETVGQVAYLAFTAGYAPGSGPDVVRVELAGEAIRLVRLVRASSPAAAAHPALTALLSLMLLQHSRREARTAADGTPVLLPEQERTRWRRDEIGEGLALLDSLTGPDAAGPPALGPEPAVSTARVAVPSAAAAAYLLQALIAAEHARAEHATQTDWVAIADLYGQLDELTASPVVRLNRAVAVAEAARGSGGAQLGLELLDGLDEQLPRSHRLPAIRAELLARTGARQAARAVLQSAIERCDNEAERAGLTRRADELA